MTRFDCFVATESSQTRPTRCPTDPSQLAYGGVLLAQEITVVTETDPLTLWVSVIAVAVALGAAVLTYLQGRATRRIDSREHEWEAEDRRTAAIWVLPQSERYSEDLFGDRSMRDTWIRLKEHRPGKGS